MWLGYNVDGSIHKRKDAKRDVEDYLGSLNGAVCAGMDVEGAPSWSGHRAL